MDDEESPGVLTLLHDIQRLLYGIWYVLELLLTASYFSGKAIVEWSAWVGLCAWNFFCHAAEGLKDLYAAVIELEESLIRGIVLVHYGIGQIYEAFQVTITDFASFVQHVQETHVQLFSAASTSFLSAIHVVIITVPQHICSALSIIGDFALDTFTQLLIFFQKFFVQLIWSPINAAMTIGSLGIRVAALPGKIITAVPFSAHVGSLIMLLVYVLYCKLSFLRLANLITVCFVKLFRAIMQMPFFLNQMRKLLSRNSSVSNDSILPSDMKGVCVVCQNNTVSYLANPCNHVCLCSACVRQIVQFDNRCPMCRNAVDHYAKVYVS